MLILRKRAIGIQKNLSMRPLKELKRGLNNEDFKALSTKSCCFVVYNRITDYMEAHSTLVGVCKWYGFPYSVLQRSIHRHGEWTNVVVSVRRVQLIRGARSGVL